MKSVTLAVLCATLVPVPANTLQAQDNRAPKKLEGVIQGRVIDALGYSVGGIPVTARHPSVPAEIRSTTNGGGIFVMRGVGLMLPYLNVEATTPQRTVGRKAVQLTPQHPLGTVTIRLWDAATIRGCTVDAQGRPLAGVQVTASPVYVGVFPHKYRAETISDEQGCFVLRKAPLGLINMRAYLPGFDMAETRTYLRGNQEMTLGMRKDSGVTLQVCVEGLGGNVKARVELTFLSNGVCPSNLCTGDTDALGRFTRSGLPNRTFSVIASAGGYSMSPRYTQVRAGPKVHGLRIRASRQGEARNMVRGMLKGPDGKPLAGQTVISFPSAWWRSFKAVTDAQGGFEIVGPQKVGSMGCYRLQDSPWVLDQKPQRRGRPYSFMNRHEAIFKPGEVLVLRAIPASRVMGTVVDHGGKPAPLTRLFLQIRTTSSVTPWDVFGWAIANSKGEFTLDGLHEMPQQLRVRALGRFVPGRDTIFKITRGKTVKGIVVRLPPRASIEGRVLDSAGRPVPGARVCRCTWRHIKGWRRADREFEVLTDRLGRYRFDDVDPGGHFLQVYLSASGAAYNGDPKGRFELKIGQARRLDIRL